MTLTGYKLLGKQYYSRSDVVRKELRTDRTVGMAPLDRHLVNNSNQSDLAKHVGPTKRLKVKIMHSDFLLNNLQKTVTMVVASADPI